MHDSYKLLRNIIFAKDINDLTENSSLEDNEAFLKHSKNYLLALFWNEFLCIRTVSKRKQIEIEFWLDDRKHQLNELENNVIKEVKTKLKDGLKVQEKHNLDRYKKLMKKVAMMVLPHAHDKLILSEQDAKEEDKRLIDAVKAKKSKSD